MNPGQALITLLAHPKEWLRTYHLTIAAPTTAAAAGIAGAPDVFRYYLGTTDDLGKSARSPLSPGRANSSFSFLRKGHKRFLLNPNVHFLRDHTPVKAVGVRAIAFADLPAVDAMGNPVPPETQVPGVNLMQAQAAGNNAANVMATSQLSGCTICVHAGVGVFYVAHIMPVRGQSSEIRTRLAVGGRFSNGLPFTHVYGPGDPAHGQYNIRTDVITIIGVRKLNAGWKLYAQKNDPNFNVVSVTKFAE